MAERSGYSKFIEAVAGDGTTAPDVRMLTGWLAPSGDAATTRLYLDASLGTYVDIPNDTLLYSEEIPNSHPSGASTVWVRNGAELREGGSALARAAKFLTGPVQQAFGAQGFAAAQQLPDTHVCLTYRAGCEPQMPGRFTRNPCSAIDLCPSALIECGTGDAFGTRQFGAQRTVPITISASGPLCPLTTIGCPDPNPSVGQPCATAKPALCPSAPQACPQPNAVPFGWTSLGCNRPTSYPQCNSSVGICATRPPCF